MSRSALWIRSKTRVSARLVASRIDSPPSGATVAASEARSASTTCPATVAWAATAVVVMSYGVPSGPQHSGSSQWYDHQRPRSTLSASPTLIWRSASSSQTAIRTGSTRSAGPYPIRRACRNPLSASRPATRSAASTARCGSKSARIAHVPFGPSEPTATRLSSGWKPSR